MSPHGLLNTVGSLHHVIEYLHIDGWTSILANSCSSKRNLFNSIFSLAYRPLSPRALHLKIDDASSREKAEAFLPDPMASSIKMEGGESGRLRARDYSILPNNAYLTP